MCAVVAACDPVVPLDAGPPTGHEAARLVTLSAFVNGVLWSDSAYVARDQHAPYYNVYGAVLSERSSHYTDPVSFKLDTVAVGTFGLGTARFHQGLYVSEVQGDAVAARYRSVGGEVVLVESDGGGLHGTFEATVVVDDSFRDSPYRALADTLRFERGQLNIHALGD